MRADQIALNTGSPPRGAVAAAGDRGRIAVLSRERPGVARGRLLAAGELIRRHAVRRLPQPIAPIGSFHWMQRTPCRIFINVPGHPATQSNWRLKQCN